MAAAISGKCATWARTNKKKKKNVKFLWSYNTV